jgi:hypothetical protein
MTKAAIATPNHPLYCLGRPHRETAQRIALCSHIPARRRAQSASTNCHVATSLVPKQELARDQHEPGLKIMQKFFFDMKDGVPLRDRVGLEFKNDADAIAHRGGLAEYFYRDSLTDDQDLEISVVNSLGREIHREFVHRR